MALLDEHYDELWVGGKESYNIVTGNEHGFHLVAAVGVNRISPSDLFGGVILNVSNETR